MKFTDNDIQPKQQYTCNKCDKPYFNKVALTTHIKKVTLFPIILPRRNSWQFQQIINQTTITKNIEGDKLEVDHAKEQE